MRWGVSHAVWVVVVVVALANAATCIPIGEFDSMLDTLRDSGYDLFCNAIVTSDLQFNLLSSYHDQNQGSDVNDTLSFTFFAPTDASLFALDMTQTASSYTETLRFHIVPRRLSLAELNRLPDGFTLPTLLPQRRLHLTRRRSSSAVAVNGVVVAVPDLFNGQHVAVHGLEGSLSLRSDNPPSPAPVVLPLAGNLHFSPRFSPVSSPENLGPVPFNFGSRRGSHPPIESPAPETSTQAPENGRVDSAPEPEADWRVDHPANLGDSPALTPVVWPPCYPDSISLPPEGHSEAAVPMEGEEGDMETPVKSEALDGIRNCENHGVGIALEDYTTHHHVPHMDYYAT